MYEIKILPNRRLTTPSFCTQTLRSSLECKIDTAVEPFREKNNNVKPACHNIYQEGIICSFSLPSLLSVETLNGGPVFMT